jgi:hypothetical protein
MRQELLEFIKLWVLLKNIRSSQEENDTMICKWMPNGKYTVTSTYIIQFQGSHALFQLGELWKANIEPKVKVLGWTVMQQKIPTTENLAMRGMQHNQTCPLRHACPEDMQHLLTNCSFIKEVLHLIWSWFHLAGSPTPGLDTQGTTS